MKDPKTLFGKRLREARSKIGISQKQLGIAAGIDEFSASARVNQYEVGTHTPTFDTAERLSSALGVPTPFFYAKDDLLAEIIIAVGQLPQSERRKLLNYIDQ